MKTTLLAIIFTLLLSSIQAQVSKTLICTAGNLSNLLSTSEKTTVTNLLLTGTIDARDFKTMRDSMPLLAVLDLSGSVITEYTGTKGTVGLSNTVYTANTLPDSAFCNSQKNIGEVNLTSIVFPSLLKKIGNAAFFGCSGLSGSINFPYTLKSIGNDAFMFCYGLTGSLILPDSVIFIGNNAFASCSGYTGSLTLPASLTYLGCGAFDSCSGFTGSLYIPNSLDTIRDETFYNCTGFSGQLQLGNSLKYIGNDAFYNCSGFSGSLIIPDSVIYIGEEAFDYCSGFSETLIIGKSVKTIGGWAFEECTGFTGSLVIPDSVTFIGRCAFSKCTGFNGTLILGNSLKIIGMEAFKFCEGFNGSLIIPNSVITIGDTISSFSDTFYKCSGFNGSLTIGTSVRFIGMSAFYDCSGFIGNLTIPESVINIKGQAFYNCKKISSITASNLIPVDLSSTSGVFGNIDKNSCTLYVPKDSKKQYASAKVWKDFLNIQEISSTLTPKQIINPGTVKIYPNPVSDYIVVNGLAGNAELCIYDLKGIEVLRREIRNNESIGVEFLARGMYVVRILTRNKIIQKTIVKE